jgi:hypothetical protein
MQGAQKIALEKEAELARQEQELTCREAAANAKRDLSKTLGGVSVTSKKQKAPPKNGAQPNAFQQEHWPGTNVGLLKGPMGSSQRRSKINNSFFFDVAEDDAGLNNDLRRNCPRFKFHATVELLTTMICPTKRRRQRAMVWQSTLGVKALVEAQVASSRLVAVTPRVVICRATGFHLDNLRRVPLSGRGPSPGVPGFPAKVRGFNKL